MSAPVFLKNLLFVLNVVVALSLGYSILHAHLTGLILAVIALIVVVGFQVWVMRGGGSADSGSKNARMKK